MELEHQGAGGHVLDLTRLVPPVPKQAEPLGKLPAAGPGAPEDELAQLRQLIGLQHPTLNPLRAIHARSLT